MGKSERGRLGQEVITIEEKRVVHLQKGTRAIYCPACHCIHGFDDRWDYNNNDAEPTFNPSMLVRMPKYRKLMDDGSVKNFEGYVCHSFVRNGHIEYLHDCSHEHAGQTCRLPVEEDWFEE